MRSLRPDEVPWHGRPAGPQDLLAAFAWMLLKHGGKVEFDTKEMAGHNIHLSARFVQRGGGKVSLIVEVDGETDPENHHQMRWNAPKDA